MKELKPKEYHCPKCKRVTVDPVYRCKYCGDMPFTSRITPIPVQEPESMIKLKPCPCGETPTKLHLEDEGCKYAYMSGNCCYEWIIEYNQQYKVGGEAYALAVDAWNNSPRGKA